MKMETIRFLRYEVKVDRRAAKHVVSAEFEWNGSFGSSLLTADSRIYYVISCGLEYISNAMWWDVWLMPWTMENYNTIDVYKLCYVCDFDQLAGYFMYSFAHALSTWPHHHEIISHFDFISIGES